ncbi:hypothetical protein C0389_06950 [bacterium]|nr:hypothetical protein [bacterium]
MVSKNQLKYYSSLLNKKNRLEEKRFLVESFKLLNETINSGFKCEIVFVLQSAVDENNDIAKLCGKRKINLEIIKAIEFGKLCDTKNPQGIVGVFHFKEYSMDVPAEEKLIVALENISDPGNMGTIIRNCDWFGVKNILLSSNCAEIYNPKVIRASAGSVFHLNLIEKNNFNLSLKELRRNGYEIVCADLEGENINGYIPKTKTILVMANEANGPSSELLKITDRKITIPKKGRAESLNVASASAVILSELTKE